MRDDIKRLYRVPAEGKIAGLCSGLGEYFRVDPVFFRLGWVAATVMTGFLPGALAYLIAWLLVPAVPHLGVAEREDPLPHSRA